jgi:predicted kinase
MTYVNQKKCLLLVGPPGSGKSTLASKEAGFTYVNQDLQKKEHLSIFSDAISSGKDVVVDRMNYNVEQRARYLDLAKSNGYQTEIKILHVPYEICLQRISKREGHETIHNEDSARSALKTFFTKYERPEDSEADLVTRIFPDCEKPFALIVDLDNTLCDISKRLHHVREGKRDWDSFFEEMDCDGLYPFCADILRRFKNDHKIVFCSGRPRDYEGLTRSWFANKLPDFEIESLFMRPSGDYRHDYIVKEIILDFEILPRFTPYFVLDDRDSVVKMWRRRGFRCLQVAEGDF